MNTKIHVDNLSIATTADELMGLFSAYGNVADVHMAVDPTAGKPRCFGLVTMVTAEGAQAAIQALNGKAIGTSTLTLSEAWPDEELDDSLVRRRSPILRLDRGGVLTRLPRALVSSPASVRGDGYTNWGGEFLDQS